ncbi:MULTISPECIES: DUF2459 domain-containing protein [Aquimarina]|uniref:DUF2459 domain-containing protein n=1 Tax=Aquimarina TaxID=290174 RepID=UPI000D6910EE|nr:MULTISPECIES: DUF2459 domain-containing protein [Aquimarina]
MKIIKKVFKSIGVFLALPMLYIIISLILTYIPVNKQENKNKMTHTVYLNSNGIHLEIIIAKNDLNKTILKDQVYNSQTRYFSFGWGDKNFYVETPTWADFTFMNGFQALFLNSQALLHVTRYSSVQKNWVAIKINQAQLKQINLYISDTFRLDFQNKKVLLPGLGYTKNDDFYEALGNYTCLNTCNSWINTGLKQSNMKACLWTPYDFGLMAMYKNK